jgi:FkbM family methyltransferase
MIFDSVRKKWLGRTILFLVYLGFGRGTTKGIFSKIWLKFIGYEPVDVKYHGIKLRLIPAGNTIESKILFGSRLREEEELQHIKAKIVDGVFFDIGANIGYYSLMAAKYGASRIVAFEPNPELAKRCRLNIELNQLSDRIELLEVALGEKNGTVNLKLDDVDLGSSSIVSDVRGAIEIAVPIVTLSEVVTKMDMPQIDVLKIDVEGMEDRILKPFFLTAQKSILPKMVIIEDSRKSDWNCDIIDWMLLNDYIIESHSRSNLILVRQ